MLGHWHWRADANGSEPVSHSVVTVDAEGMRLIVFYLVGARRASSPCNFASKLFVKKMKEAPG